MGFDPSRCAAARLRYGDIPEADFERYYVAEAISRACVMFAYPEAPPQVVERLVDAFAVKCLPEAEAAIVAVREYDARDSDRSGEAIETRSGSTEGESAGPKDIAQ